MSDSAIFFVLISSGHPKANYDYSPQWGRGTPNTYIDNKYSYRVVKNDTDLGIRDPYEVQGDGSQKVNFLEYNKGYGIEETSRIRVYAVDPTNGNQYLVAQWH
ncbi:immunomodulatory protein FIP-Fve [Trametes punicea]|nr:immunomodulatory protein FIP-Fve [Trametes punicea]